MAWWTGELFHMFEIRVMHYVSKQNRAYRDSVPSKPPISMEAEQFN